MKTRTFARRVADLVPEGAYAMLGRARELETSGRDIIHLEIGEPDFPTASYISHAGQEAIAAGYTRYNPPAGLPALRRKIAKEAGARRGIEIEPEQVIIGPGAKPGLFFSTLALVEAGDEVLYPEPGFPTYPAMISVAGGRAIPLPLQEESGFTIDLDALDRLMNQRTRLIILNSPSNPTGSILPVAELAHIARVAIKQDCWVISDEIYSRFVYDDQAATSIASLPGMAERTIIVDGFSKTYGMTGWRLGYAIMPSTLAERVELLITHSIGCTATFTQMAGLAALEGEQDLIDATVREYQKRRDLIVEGLNAIAGIKCKLPQGAFYVFPNITGTGYSSRQLAFRLLEDAGVAVLPGTDFGESGEGFLRLCFAVSPQTIRLALERISKVIVH